MGSRARAEVRGRREQQIGDSMAVDRLKSAATKHALILCMFRKLAKFKNESL